VVGATVDVASGATVELVVVLVVSGGTVVGGGSVVGGSVTGGSVVGGGSVDVVEVVGTVGSPLHLMPSGR
jgi:hypothetical protein